MRATFLALLLLVSPFALAEDVDPELISSPNRAQIEAQKLSEVGATTRARELYQAAVERYPDHVPLLMAYSRFLMRLDQFGEAEIVLRQAQRQRELPEAQQMLQQIEKYYEVATGSLNSAVVRMQNNTDAGNYETTIAIGNRAISRYPDKDVLYKDKGHAQFLKGDLDEADATLRRALQINPRNTEALQLVEMIRAAKQAQTSTELAEWISIAKDKVGDFIVTFLALFAAFVVNSAVEPIILRIKLNRARRLFEHGDYDEFTDLIEGLLDLENFAPLRANFRFLLERKSIDEAKDILNKYVNTLERLPTLIRILEREHEKMVEAS